MRRATLFLLVTFVIILAGCFPANTHYRKYGEDWSEDAILLSSGVVWTAVFLGLAFCAGILFGKNK